MSKSEGAGRWPQSADRRGRSYRHDALEGRLIFGVFAAFSEFERELIRERTKAGMRAARRRGKRVGRPRILTPEKLDLAHRLLAEAKAGQSQPG